MALLGDCQSSWQLSSPGTVGVEVEDGKADATEGVEVDDGKANATGGVEVDDGKTREKLGVEVEDGKANRTVGVTDSIGSGVVDGLGVRDCLSLAAFEGDAIGVPLGTTTSVGIASQAARVNARPTQSSTFLIVALVSYS